VPEPRAYYSDRGLSAAYYDLLTGMDATLAGDVELYASLAPAGGGVLDLGAGTGRVAFALAERGYSVVGIEPAPAMLAQALAKRSALPADVAARVDLRRGDMTALKLERAFDVVVCAFFGLAHLPAGAAWANAFEGMARHLAPGGRVAVHLPLRARLAELPQVDPRRPVLRVPADAGATLELFVRSRSFREAIGRFDQVLEYRVTDARGSQRRSLERQTYYVGDAEAVASRFGLSPDRPPVALGDAGEVHVFRKT